MTWYQGKQQIVGIPMGINCAPLVADLSFFKTGTMASPSNDKQAPRL